MKTGKMLCARLRGEPMPREDDYESTEEEARISVTFNLPVGGWAHLPPEMRARLHRLIEQITNAEATDDDGQRERDTAWQGAGRAEMGEPGDTAAAADVDTERDTAAERWGDAPRRRAADRVG